MIKGLSAIVLAFVILITFPIWMALIAGGFGIVAGIFGAILGIIFGFFGALFGALGMAFNMLFGGIFSWDGPSIHFPHVHWNGFGIAAIIIALAIVVRGRKNP